MNVLMETALGYAELGYWIFPVAPATKVPLTQHGHLEATCESDQIERWWGQRPNANIGMATEGLVVIDVDAGSTWLADNPDREIELAAAPLSLTANNGRQYIFRPPKGKEWRNTTGRLAPHVDTRANGGYIVVPPSILEGGKGYRWAEGMELDDRSEKLPEPPGWLIAELDRLAAGGPISPPVASSSAEANPIPSGQRNATLARLAGTMRRVGMSQGEILAALEKTNADRCVPPLNAREVVRITASVSRYAPDEVSVAIAENHYAQDFESVDFSADESTTFVDPGPLPEEVLRVPGFVSELMDHCLETAPYPNVVLAFCGALAMQSFLAARKVRDPGDNRTNLYLLGLAHSSAGKDWPRKINTQLAHAIGMADGLGERFASGEGIQDSLNLTPAMLFQTDEVDGMLSSINKSRDGRHESIMSTLLTMYSSANSVYPMRRKAGRESPGVIDQPSLTLFGTAIPNHYYDALSERMLTNGLFARMVIFESTKRPGGQEPRVRGIPPRLLETAKWWSDYHPGGGNLQNWHPVPTVVEFTDAAQQLVIEARQEAEREYAVAEEEGDAVGTTVWGRVSEQIRKLALLYAVSANHHHPHIDEAGVTWAIRLVLHQTRRMLFQASDHVSHNEFDAQCKQLLRALRAWKDKHGDVPMPEWQLNRKLPWKPRDHEEVRHALVAQKRINFEQVPTKTQARKLYRLLE